MDLKVTQAGQAIVVTPNGDLGEASAAALKRALHPFVPSSASRH